jgi:hypothetical protein
MQRPTMTQVASFDSGDVPTVDDFKNIGVVEYAVAEERTETLALSDQGYLTFGGQQPSIVYDVTGHTYNLIPVTQSVANDANQTPYFVIDTSGDGSVSSDDAMVSSAHFAIRELPSVDGGYYPAGYLDKVYPASDVSKVLQNNTALQIEGQSYATARYSTDRSQQWVITWKNGGAVEEQIAADAATIYIADPSESAVQSISSTSISGAPALVAGNHYSFDVSDASLAGETFELLKASEDSGIALTVTGTPGQPNALIEFTVPASMTGSLTLTSTSVTVERSAPILGGMSVDITGSNIDAVNELFAATTVGADAIDSDLPATTAAEDQAVIDQGATRLQALLKIANYAQNNGVDTTTYPAPDAADFAAAGVTGVADDNNVATLLTRLRGTTSETNFAKADTAAELQAFVKKVAIDKIAKWADTDGDTVADGTGVNAVAPILQDYVNAGLVDPNDNAITAAMVPALNELFASNAVNTDAADSDALQQGIIDGAATQLAAMAKIASYAGANGAIDLDNDAGTGDANGYDQLTVADFDAIGVFGVGDGTGVSTGSGVNTSNTTFNNLTAVLNKLAEAGITYVNADTAAEVQALVGQVAVEKIAYYADEDGQLPLATQTIAVAVDAKTGGGNAFYLDLDGDPATTAEEAPALDLAPGTYTFTQSDASNVGHPLTFFLNNDRSGDVATQGITVTSTGVAGSNGVTTLVIPEGFDGTLYYECENHNGMGNSVDVAVPYFEPELQDYTNAGLKSYDGTSDVVATDVASLNEIFAGVNIGGASDSYHADDAANQQAAIVANAAYLQAIEKIAQYAEDGNSSSLGVPTAADYDAAGIVGVYDSNNNGGVTGTPSNISVINQAILDDTVSFTDANTAVEIQVIVSRGRITHYANTNGLDDQATPAPLAAALVPTVADYANVGVTEIYDGSSLVAIDNNNLEQVNDLMAMRYVGNPDTNGDGTVNSSDNGRVDVINNATDAATNETNLTYAGAVNTVAKIQDAVTNAMGTAAADGRAAALNKIAAFSQAVSGLADQAAYDAYIADANNSAMIPTASDYNSAGVLGLTDSTEEITDSLATAINAKLFTGSADATVNTVEELQPYVDSANTIVDKIGAWAEPDWSGIGSVESFVSLIPSFENSSFDTVNGGDIQGWTKYIGVVNLGVTQLAGFTSPVESNTGADSVAAGGYLSDLSSWPSGGAAVSVISDPDDSGRGNVVLLNTGSNTITTRFGIEHGPAIYSNSAITLTAGATVTLDWKAAAGGDAADVVGYLQNVNDGTTIKLLDYTSPSAGAETSWNSKSVTIPDGKEGDYKFVFVGGSFDFTGGMGVGAAFYIDNVEVRYITSPLKFNGLINSNGESDWQKAQALFDQLTYADNSAALAWTSDTVPTSVASVQVGWFDAGDTGVSTGVLDHFNLYPKNNGSGANAFDGLPSDFDILGWDNNAGQWEIIKTFNLAAPTNVHSNSNALTYDVSDVSTKAYTGFKLDIRDTFGGGVVEMTEFDLQVRSVSVADLVSGSEPTYQEYAQVGVVGVDASNISDINALVFAKPSRSEVATIPLIQAIVDNYTASMSTIEAFTNSDGASDGNLNFTSDAGEAGVPTASDYQAIGVRYIVNSDGLNIPISSSNIAAINEVLAQATYGDDQSDTVITTAAELRSVLNSDAVAARLTAIDKISKLATATESTLTLVDDATTPTVVSGDTVNLTLTGPYGSPEVLTATLSDIGGWVGIAAELTADLSAYSGFTIVSTANGITITRADGANFSVAANNGTGTWTLTDSTNANSTLALSSNTASGTISVLGTGPQLTVADFAAVGLTDVDGSVIQEAVQRVASKTAREEVDTKAELQVFVDFTPPEIASVSVQSGAFKAGDTVEVVITALNNEAGLTLDTALFNGRALTNIIDNGDGTYTGTYTVVAGDADVLANNDVTTSLGFTDPAGNPGPLETTVTLSAGTDIEPAAYALRAFDSYLNPPLADVVDAGTFQLIKPVVVDGGKVFYLYSSNGTSITPPNLSTVKGLFGDDINGNNGTVINGTYRYGSHNGLQLKLAELGATSNVTYTNVSGNEVNSSYDGLAAIFDAYDGEPDPWADIISKYMVFLTDRDDRLWKDEDYEHNSGTTWITDAGTPSHSFGDVYTGGSSSYFTYGPLIIEVLNPSALPTSSGIAEPSLVIYEALGIDDYYDGSDYYDLTSELIALANEIVAGISGTLSANAIQAALDTASDKLTAMQKVLDYVADQNNPIPTADDYNAIDLGRTISSSEVAALNTAAVSAGVSATDTAAELALLLPIPSITIDSISEDTSDQPPLRDIAVGAQTNANGIASRDRLLDINDLQVGDYITLTLQGESYTTPNPVTELTMAAIRQLILFGTSGTFISEPTYTAWSDELGGVLVYEQNPDVLIRFAEGMDLSTFEIKAGGNAMPDFITRDDDGLTIVATLSAELAEGQRLELRTDSGAAWTDITASVTGTAVSYDSSLATTATVEMRVVNAADSAGTVASQLITIDTTAPTITNPALSFGGVLSSSAVAAAATIAVPLSGVEDGQDVTLTLNSKTYSSQATSDSASFTISSADLNALPGGSITYQVDVSDVAGNAATTYTGSFTKSVAGFAGIDADADGSGLLEFTSTNAVAGTSGSADSTAKVALDVSKASAGDTVELYVDGTLVWSDTLDAGEISSGTLIADNGSGEAINFDNYDSTVAGSGVDDSADIVTLEVKLKNSGGYVQEGGDVTWDYQW